MYQYDFSFFFYYLLLLRSRFPWQPQDGINGGWSSAFLVEMIMHTSNINMLQRVFAMEIQKRGIVTCDSCSEWIGWEICCRCINPYYGMCCVCRWGLLMHHLCHFAFNRCFILFRVVTHEGERHGVTGHQRIALTPRSASEVSINPMFTSLDCGWNQTMQIQWSGNRTGPEPNRWYEPTVLTPAPLPPSRGVCQLISNMSQCDSSRGRASRSRAPVLMSDEEEAPWQQLNHC